MRIWASCSHFWDACQKWLTTCVPQGNSSLLPRIFATWTISKPILQSVRYIIAGLYKIHSLKGAQPASGTLPAGLLSTQTQCGISFPQGFYEWTLGIKAWTQTLWHSLITKCLNWYDNEHNMNYHSLTCISTPNHKTIVTSLCGPVWDPPFHRPA